MDLTEEARPYVPGRKLAEIKADLACDKNRELLFRARSLLVTSLWTIPPRKMIRELVLQIDEAIEREALVGLAEKEQRG